MAEGRSWLHGFIDGLAVGVLTGVILIGIPTAYRDGERAKEQQLETIPMYRPLYLHIDDGVYQILEFRCRAVKTNGAPRAWKITE